MATYGVLKYPTTGLTVKALLQNADGSLWNGAAYVAPSSLANTAAWRAILIACTEKLLADSTATGEYVTANISAAGPCVIVYFSGATPSPGDTPLGIQDMSSVSQTTDIGNGVNLTKILGTAIPAESVAGRDAAALGKFLDVAAPVLTAESKNQSEDVVNRTSGNFKIASTTDNWATAGTWTGGVVPAAGDNIIINDGITVTIAASLDLGQFGTLQINGDGALNIAGSQTVAIVPVGWKIATNLGLVTDNRGTIANNNGTIFSGGTVGTNNGTITLNDNYGTVTLNYGTVTTNAGAVSINAGLIAINNSMVTNNSGTVTLNTGTVTTNSNYRTVITNLGTVGTNNGTITTNAGVVTTNPFGGRVETNDGTVTTNASGGIVVLNNATVGTNASGGIVVLNNATVTTDNGTTKQHGATTAVAPVKTQTDKFTFVGSRVKSVAPPSHGGIGGNAFQFKLTSAAATAKVWSPGETSIVDTHILDATQRVTTDTEATTGTQWQVSVEVLQDDPGASPVITLSSSDESVATVNSEGLVEYVGSGTCNIIGISKATEFSPSQRYELAITNSTAGGQSTITTTYIPDAFDAAKHVLIVYNADVADSVTLKNYYLANRPGMTTANVLGLTGLADGTSVNLTSVSNLILTPTYNWLVANEATKPIRYIVVMRGVPSRQGTTGSVAYMLYHLLADRAYRTGVGYSGGESRFNRAQYQDVTCLPCWIDMGSYPASTAYIDKLAAAASGVQADGVTISGATAGVAGTKWLFDEKQWLGYPQQYADDVALVEVEGILVGNVTYQSSPTGTPITSAVDPLWYGSWGYYTLLGDLPSHVTFTGLAGWWGCQMVESYGGIYGNYMPDPTEIFAATAFGGTSYSNTPIGFVGFTAEPYLGGVQSAYYPGRWARGWTFSEAAWCGSNSPQTLAVGDPLVMR